MRIRQGREKLPCCFLLWRVFIVLMAAVWPFGIMAQDADCAEVKIVIEQKLSIERQAFDARMVVRNGLDEALSNVKIELFYQDQYQQPVSATSDPSAIGATFFQRLDSMEGISSLEGGALAGKTEADIHWLIIPSYGAGGTTAEGLMYYIGARVTYTLAGETTTVDVTPDYVVVRPQPLLVLDYFLPTDVYADDALTPEVEPVEPFTLGVRLSNIGAGVSAKTTIESAQPRIVENNQGLLIDFRILGGYVGNDMLGKSMLLDFGDLSGQETKVGRWLMETSLAGRFVEFNASFTHADSLGGEVTSLLQDVRTHRLVHDVLVDLPGHDDVYDFLAEFGTGYRVYDSEGADTDVADVSGQASIASVSGGGLHLTYPVSAILSHVKIADPFKGAKPITRVVRSDGKVLPVNNFWLSKTRNVDLSWSYFLHVFDSNSTGDYILEFGQGAVASISGSAYRDNNTNGVRDADEPAEGNLGVVLKGIDEHGQSILRQTHTDAFGSFGFIDLKPGRYQLEAAIVDGLVDGVWATGNAGGTVQEGLIKDINLTAGLVGAGYLIAKRKPTISQDQDQADVSIAVQAARAQLRSEEIIDVVVTVHNAGASTAQGVIAHVAVPDGLKLQNTISSQGSYVNGVWMVGGLTKGQDARLTLSVKADKVPGSESRMISWPVAVSASTNDLQADNNSALLGLTIRADDTVTMLQSIPVESRVLMMLSCQQASHAEQSDCEQQEEQTAQTVLAASVSQLHTVTTLSAWHIAQRSGAYNVLWLHGGADKLDAQAVAEVRAAIRRGSTLVIDGVPGATNGGFKLNQLADITGARVMLPAIGDSPMIKFSNEPADQSVTGMLYGLELDNAQVLATASSTHDPVMASATWGHGQSWLMGFDLLATLANSSTAFWSDYTSDQLLAVTPVFRAKSALAGTRLPLRINLHNLAPQGETPQEVRVRVQLPEGVDHSNVSPSPAHDDKQLVEWAWSLAPADNVMSGMRLVLPQMSATLKVQSELLDNTGEILNVEEQAINVLGLNTIIPQVETALNSLSSNEANIQEAIGRVRQAVGAAQAAQQLGEWEEVLSQLADAQTNLETLTVALQNQPIDMLRLDVARWIGIAQQQWASSNAGGSLLPAELEVVSGSGQSAVVSTAFAKPLQVRVKNEQGQPVSDVKVRFVAPDSGASARFHGDVLTMDAVTDNQGLAIVSLTANTNVGSYDINAQVDGLKLVSYSLTNLSDNAIDMPAALKIVSGAGQSAQVGTAFAAPMVIQVLNNLGQPLSDIPVQFTFGTKGAGASFDGGQISAVAVTNTDGKAQSPAFTGNGLHGSFQALITVEGLMPLTVELTNLPVKGVSKEFEGSTATGTGSFKASVSGGGDTCMFNPDETRLIPPKGIWTPLQKFLLPHGLFDFELVGCDLGGEATITTTWPDLRGITGYMKYGKTALSKDKEIWYAPKNVRIDLSNKSISYTIRDGGLGDDDLTINGVIKDPGGPSIALAKNATPVPTLDRWALLLLALALGLTAILHPELLARRHVRRRS